MKKLPLGIQSFRKIIEGGYVYVDKTQYVYNLLNDAKYYFLSRPRRFGKSLLIDTIGEVFNGDRELFRGLYISDSGYDFEKYPVLRLDMSNVSSKTPEILEESLLNELRSRVLEEQFDLDYNIPSDLFKNLIRKLFDKYGKPVVVLIDEYDKPILDRLGSIATAEANREVLKGFYGILKSMDPFLRLTFITGVSKFAKTSIFSELNNLYDITFDEKYNSICGIPIEELDKHFDKHIDGLASAERFMSYENTKWEILDWYDGYSWDGESRVINPFSLLSFFTRKKLASFWYASGTPAFLMEQIKKDPSVYSNLRNLKITELMLDCAELDNIEAELLLFQSGYLTVKEVIPTAGSDIYLLEMPNFEVREAFHLHALTAMTGGKQSRVKEVQQDIDQALQAGDMEKVLEVLRGLFAMIPYQLHIDHEAYYHSIFLAVMNVLGFDVDAEVSVSGGRVDAVLELDDIIHIVEFKYLKYPVDSSDETKRSLIKKALDAGMKQISDKGYAKKYTGSGKTICQTAFAFLGRDSIEMKCEIPGQPGQEY